MPTQSTFVNGQQLTSSALTLSQLNTLVQNVICQILNLNPGVLCQVSATLGSNVVTVDNAGLLLEGMLLAAPGAPSCAIVEIDDVNITLDTAMVITGSWTLAFNADPLAFYLVRVGWQKEGQPAWLIDEDVCTVIPTLVDDAYNRVRNSNYAQNTNGVDLLNSVSFTRAWDFSFSLYGPNSLDRARLIRSALFLDWVHDLFIANNLAMIPELKEAVRLPEKFDEQWWERVDFSVTFYEEVTETISVPAIASAEIILEVASGITLGVGQQGWGEGPYGGGPTPNTIVVIDVGSQS